MIEKIHPFRAICLIVKKYIKFIEFHSDNMNKGEGFSMNKLWKPFLQTLKE
jgi:hypothetical protein